MGSTIRSGLIATLLSAVGVAQADLTYQTLVTGLTLPVSVIQDPTNPAVQFVVQQRGRIKVVQNGVLQGTDFLNLVGTVNSTGGERGLLGLAFHPNYAVNGYFYVNYTSATNGSTRIVRYTRTSPLVANAGSAYPILTISQPYNNHNGGTLRFGPDGYLYIGMGDGGNQYDPGNRAQTITGSLLGKFLRLNVDSDGFPTDTARNYSIPPTNPFVGITGDDEIWSIGLRNPWKFHFDNPTWLGSGGLVIGDVGQDLWEELNYEPPLAGGRNYGWRNYEGNHTTGLSGASTIPPRFPIYEYPHDIGLSITCGPIYRGILLPGFFGRSFFADYDAGRLFSGAMFYGAGGEANPLLDVVEHTAEIGLPSTVKISSIDVDANGDLMVADLANGAVYKILSENSYRVVDLQPQIYSTYTGQVRSVLANDNHVLTLFPQNVWDLFEENQSQMVFGFTTDVTGTAPITLNLAASSNATSGGRLQTAIRNWNTNKFDNLNLYNITTSVQTFTRTDIAPGSYRRADGRIEILIKSFYPGNPPSDPYQCHINWIGMNQ